jgi:hypothetical protein
MKDNAGYDHVARWATHLCNVESDRWYDIITNSNLMEYGTPPTPSIEYWRVIITKKLKAAEWNRHKGYAEYP